MRADGLAKVVVLGSGSAGLRHAAVVRQLPHTEVSVVPIRPERAPELHANGWRTHASLDDAVGWGASHAIIATDTARHPSDATAALSNGLDVLIEKPMAADARAGRDVCDHAKAHNRRLAVGCTLRFSDSLGVFAQRVQDLGALHAVRIECRSYLPDWRPSRRYQDSYSARADEGGVLRDLIHEIDYAGWLFGWPAALSARLRNTGRLGIESEELADLSWVTPSGAALTISLDYLTRPARRSLCAYGQHGSVVWDAIAQTVTTTIDGRARVDASTQTRDEMFTAQDAAFVSGNDADAKLASGADGVRALAICDAARRSSAKGAEEPVGYP